MNYLIEINDNEAYERIIMNLFNLFYAFFKCQNYLLKDFFKTAIFLNLSTLLIIRITLRNK